MLFIYSIYIYIYIRLTTLLSVAYTIHSLTGGYSGGPINLSGQLNNLVDILVS